MFHASQLVLGQSEASATTVVAGSAVYPREMALPRGAELRAYSSWTSASRRPAIF
jgi:hypothetical protein